jgi:uncharacterized protein YndB with AHSA1/START domain
MTDTIPTEVADNHLYISRVFNAPVDVVWKFWTEPEYLSKWFGPHQVHTPIDKINVQLRPGGRWDITMVDNDSGEEYPLRATLVEVIKHELILGTEDITADKSRDTTTENGQPETDFLRVQFHDQGDTTRVTIHQGPFTDEFKELTRVGWGESFDKIDTILAAGEA